MPPFNPVIQPGQVPTPEPPIIVNVQGVGNVSFPAGTSQADMEAALKQIPAPASAAPAASPPPDSWGQRIRDAASSIGIPTAVTEEAIGAGKSVLGTVKGGADLIRQIPGVGPALDRLPSYQMHTPITLTANDTPQAIGKLAGNAAQFMAPSGAVGKAKAALATGRGVLDALVGAGLEASSAGAVQAAQTGDVKSAVPAAVAAGAMSVAAPAVLKGVGWLGQRVENALIKPSTTDVNYGGFNVQNVFKYKLGGSLSQSYDKSQQALDNLSSQLNGVLAQSPGTVDLGHIVKEVEAGLKVDAPNQFGSNAQIQRALGKFSDELTSLKDAGLDPGRLNLSTANRVKQAIGDMGAWLAGSQDPEANATEKVANALYERVKTAIEEKATGPAASINRQIGDILPIRQAIIRRIPVEQRANIMNLGDLLGVSSHTLGLSLANRLLRSGNAADVMVGASQLPTAWAAPAAGAVVGEAAR